MKFSDTSLSATPEVLKRKLGAEYLKEITLDASAFLDGSVLSPKVPAGTAIQKDGKLSSGDGSDVYGITLNDTYDDNPNTSVIVASAVINGANSTATSSDRTALASKVVLFE